MKLFIIFTLLIIAFGYKTESIQNVQSSGNLQIYKNTIILDHQLLLQWLFYTKTINEADTYFNTDHLRST